MNLPHALNRIRGRADAIWLAWRSLRRHELGVALAVAGLMGAVGLRTRPRFATSWWSCWARPGPS